MTKRIIVTLEGQEGAFHIDAEGKNITPADERPVWAENYAHALWSERTGWYEKRLGEQLPEAIRMPETIDARDLGWIAFDHEGDEVELEADNEYRMDQLAKHLDIDRMDFDQERNFQKATMSAEVDHTYRTHPTDEATLEEAEKASFEEDIRVAQAG